MPIKSSQMAKNAAETTITYEGDSVTIVFYPNKVTNKAIAQLDGSLDEFDATLAQLIKSWDVLEDDESMTPPTVERLADMSFPFKIQVARAIMSAIRPEAQTT